VVSVGWFAIPAITAFVAIEFKSATPLIG